MLSQSSRKRILKSIPDLIDRARLGDQNALSLLISIRQSKQHNPRAAFSYESALSYVKKNPKTETGIATIAGDESNILSTLSPLAVAILIIPVLNQINYSNLHNARLIEIYIISLTAARNGDFSRFPAIKAEQ
jgi:hypothetical protein